MKATVEAGAPVTPRTRRDRNSSGSVRGDGHAEEGHALEHLGQHVEQLWGLPRLGVAPPQGRGRDRGEGRHGRESTPSSAAWPSPSIVLMRQDVEGQAHEDEGPREGAEEHGQR